MKELTIQQIRQAVGGRNLSPIPANAPPISAVCTDTRRMEKGSLFVALRGDNFDAHSFLRQAAGGGALAALVDHMPADPLPNVYLIHVPDTRVALGRLATFVRRQMRCKVIAVAGSNGKTSTKNLIDSALRAKLRGSISPKSFNNDIGVPLTIFAADPNQDYLVLEMGTNHEGEIRNLAEMGQPDTAVITNCSAEHLEGLKDIGGVRREEASIIAGLNDSGVLVVNGDDEELLVSVSGFTGRRVTFGLKPSNDLFAADIHCDEHGVRFLLNGNARRPIHLPLLGRHTAVNALAAIAVARRMGLDEDLVTESLAEARGPEMRLQLQQLDGITVLNDAYNANPASMRAALDTLCTLRSGRRRIAVLGDMRELGKSTDWYHRELGEYVATCKLDLLVCVGPKAALLADVAIDKGMPARHVLRHASSTTAAKAVAKLIRHGDVILLKGSRAMRLEAIAESLVTRHVQPFFRKVAS